MGGSNTTLSIVLKLVDEASAAMLGVGAKMKAVGEGMTSAGRSLSVGLTLPIAALGYAVVDSSMKFQASMELIRTQAGATQTEVDNMTKSVLALAQSGETGQGPQKLADGLYHLESLGLRGAQAMDALKTSAQAADLGIADMEGVTNALGAAIVTGIKGTQNMQQAMGLLDATIGQGNMRMDDMVAALGTGILPAAKNFGLTLQDVGAALATLTDNGMRADESATRLRMTFSLIAAPTKKAKDALAEIGLGAYQLANDMRGPNGLVTAVDDLKAHLENSGKTATEQAAIMSNAFGGGRTSAAILTLVEQSDRLKTKFDQIGASADTFNEKVQATHDTNLYKLNAAMAAIQVTLIDLGATVMPMVAAGLQKLTTIFSIATEWWDRLNPGIQKFIVITLAVLAVLGPLLIIIGILITAFSIVMPIIIAVGIAIAGVSLPVLALIAATAFLAYEVATHWNEIIDYTSNLIIKFKKAFDDGIAYVKNLWNDLWSTISGVVNNILSAIQSVTSAVSSVGSRITSGASTALHAIVPHFASGGIVTGPTLALIGEAGPEAVVPLGKSGGLGTNINITITGNHINNSMNLRRIASEVSDEIVRTLRMNQKLAI